MIESSLMEGILPSHDSQINPNTLINRSSASFRYLKILDSKTQVEGPSLMGENYVRGLYEDYEDSSCSDLVTLKHCDL